MYSAKLLDHFENPRNVGEVDGASAKVRVENPVCGDVLELSVRVDDGRMSEVRFRAKGCAASIACGSVLTELLSAASLADAKSLTIEQIVALLGGLSPTSRHAAALAIDALNQVLASKGKLTANK